MVGLLEGDDNVENADMGVLGAVMEASLSDTLMLIRRGRLSDALLQSEYLCSREKHIRWTFGAPYNTRLSRPG